MIAPRTRYAVDLVYDDSDWSRSGTKTSWALVDIVSRKILEKADSFESLCLAIMAKYGYGEGQVSFDKVSGRSDVVGFLRDARIPHLEGDEYVTY